ncbi:Ion channel [Bifidobacterium sp. DSM 109960]|uniref:Ion channel n=2 Tax=Bifidobacterium erythrocebi TaxID=2675325 RepID=A0A7Y0HTB0_9BIFI|nr:Ion channel [Bifidobacterium sp. DSM 109960]
MRTIWKTPEKKETHMPLSKWERITEWPMTALALIFVFAYSWEVIVRTHMALCDNVINIIWVLFIIDYVVSISLARNKKAWFKNNLIMLLSIVLPMFRPLRLVRLVAVLNVLNRTSGMAVRGRITMYVCGSAVLLIFIGSLAVLDVEQFAPGATITDFGKALWWTFVTVTTVGYGDLSPVTWQGKCIAVGLMITGIALIGVVTATLASWIVDRVDNETSKRAKENDDEIKQLQHSISQLAGTVAELRDELHAARADATSSAYPGHDDAPGNVPGAAPATAASAAPTR